MLVRYCAMQPLPVKSLFFVFRILLQHGKARVRPPPCRFYPEKYALWCKTLYSDCSKAPASGCLRRSPSARGMFSSFANVSPAWHSWPPPGQHLARLIREDAESLFPQLYWSWGVTAHFNSQFRLCWRLAPENPRLYGYRYWRKTLDKDFQQLCMLIKYSAQ